MSISGSGGSADLYITDRCGFNCQHCFLGNQLNSGQVMSVEEVRGIVAYLKDADYSEITLLGGEPFQHPYLAEIAQEVESAGLKCRIITNGYRQAHRLLGAGILSRNIELAFSVDGGHSAVHDAIRREGSFAQLAETSRLALEMGYSISAIISVSAQNVGNIWGTLGFCDEVGYQQLTVHHVTARGNAAQDSVLGNAEWDVVQKVVSKFSAATAMRIRCEDPFFSLQPESPLRCAVRDQSNMMFFPDGRVYSCLLFIDVEGGNSSFWNGKEVVRTSPAQGELAACLGSEAIFSCPAVGSMENSLYPASHSPRIRCIYDKVLFEPSAAM